MKQKISIHELTKNELGRVTYTENGAIALSWSLSGFEANIRADRVLIHLVPDYRADQPAYLKLTLDGKSQKHAVVTGAEKLVIENMGEGVHTLRLVRLSEGEAPVCVEAIELDGEILPPPAMPERRMEFLGDSITCGYGVLSDGSLNGFRTWEEDPTRTWAYMTAEAFGADMRAVSISGQGVVLNCNGDVGTPIPTFFEYESRRGREQHDFTSWIPQVVVVNAGTNDGGGRVPDDAFGEGVDKFLARIREVYPDAHIFYVYGMMGLRYDAVLQEVIGKRCETDDRLCYVPIRPIYEFEGEVGASGHPTEKASWRVSEQLIKVIKSRLWG